MTQSNTTSPHAPTMTVAEKAQILDQIAANLPLLINVNNLSLGQFTFVSPAWEDLTGLPVKVWLERPDAWQDIVHPDDRDATIDLAEAGKKRAMRARATRILHQDGTVHTIHGWTFPVYDADGNISLVVGVAEDISAWKATERELRARQVELEQQL
ncbi:MAG: PAS domain-containing protein, partial [Myxococcales bacterium]|nr:PAS domain-containing protein [Myxococcales bacterium]